VLGLDHNQGAEIVTPKTSRGKDIDRGCPSPQPTRGLRQRRTLPKRGPGRVLVYLELERTHLIATNFTLLKFFLHIFGHIHIHNY